jgi:hypothetical protein
MKMVLLVSDCFIQVLLQLNDLFDIVYEHNLCNYYRSRRLRDCILIEYYFEFLLVVNVQAFLVITMILYRYVLNANSVIGR